MVWNRHSELAPQQARDGHGWFASGCTSSPPPSTSSSDTSLEMWCFSPGMEKNARVWFELDDDSWEDGENYSQGKDYPNINKIRELENRLTKVEAELKKLKKCKE
jgi:hypothetical protein